MSDPIVVMKFGGTSVATSTSRGQVARKVAAAIDAGRRPVVVVSAMGRAGDPYATDTLCSLVDGLPTDASELDVLMATGETISAVLLAAVLRGAGIPARFFDGARAGILTSSEAGRACVLSVDTSSLVGSLERGEVPVVTGFQGISEEGGTTTLGRGGSDTTACALGVALDAEVVEIYKDVEGVMTADPCAVDDTHLIEVLGRDELFEMSNAGAKVVHTPAAELALLSGIPLRIRSTFGEGEGTEVCDIASRRPCAVATAISSQDGISRIRVRLPQTNEDSVAHMEVQTEVFVALADAGISVDMFTPMNDRLVLSVDERLEAAALAALEPTGYECAVRRGLSKVTVIGAGMHGVVGVMARVERALCAAGIDVLQSADSHATISVLVDGGACPEAIRALHREFGL